MTSELLKKFNREAYSELNDEEKKKLIIQAVRSIQNENDLREAEIEFKSGQFGYDSKNKKLIIDLDSQDSYVILTGIIHELRHQWKSEKENLTILNTTGPDYILSPHEADAHEYTISEMQKYADFFNKDEFDVYLVKLKEQYLAKRNSAIYGYKRCGYCDIEEISTKMALYKEKSALCTAEELEKKAVTEKESIMFDNGIIGQYRINQNNKNIWLKIPGFTGTVIGNDLYINNFNVGQEISTEMFVQGLQIFQQCLEEFQDIGLELHFSNIHFPPAIVGFGGIEKSEYDIFLSSLNCNDGTIAVDDLSNQNYARNYVLRRTINEWPDGMESTFGIDYLQEYTDEQVKVLNMAKEWEVELDELKNPIEYDEEDETKKDQEQVVGFFAGYQYKKDYSPRKLRLILAGQKRGLDTFYYDEIDEKQIEEVMMLQLEGFERKDWIKLIQGELDVVAIRKKLEETRPNTNIISYLNLDDDCNIILPQKTTDLITDAVKETESVTTISSITEQEQQIISENKIESLRNDNNVQQP